MQFASIETRTDDLLISSGFTAEHVDSIKARYAERHRYYHTWDHILTFFHDDVPDGVDWPVWVLAALYHDIVYDPRSKPDENEKRSIELFKQHHELYMSDWRPNVVNQVCEVIWATRPSNSVFKTHTERHFCFRDRAVLELDPDKEESVCKLLEYEIGIEKEYQYVPWSVYKKGRLEFFSTMPQTAAIKFLRSYVLAKIPSIGIYAGSFYPWHAGHLSILRQAEKNFDKVILAVGTNPAKESAKLLQERTKNLASIMRYHQVEGFSGLLTDFLKKVETEHGGRPVLVRGLRTDTDFKSEEIQLRFMQDMDPTIQVIFIAADKSCEHVASSFIRSITQYDLEKAARYLVSPSKAYGLTNENDPDPVELVYPLDEVQEGALQCGIQEILIKAYQHRILLSKLRKELVVLFNGEPQVVSMSDRRMKERLRAMENVILRETPEGTIVELQVSK